MRYIRTKDDIAICSIELDGCYYCPIYDNPQLNNKEYQRIYNCQITKGNEIILTGDFYCIYKNSIIKQADTIEELCDEFVVEYTNTEPTMFDNFYHLQRHFDLYSQDYHHIAGRYGCIWVAGKGLIYVAKMNDKGELELL